MKDILNKRRSEFLKDKAEPYVAVLYSGLADEHFEVNRNFYYYTNIKRDNMILVMGKMGGREFTRLFIEPYDEWMAKWVGGKMKKDEAQEISGINDIAYVESFDGFIEGLIGNCRSTKLTLASDLWSSKAKINPANTLVQRISKEYPQVIIEDTYATTSRQRMIKDESELANMRVAQEHTRMAIEAMMKAAHPGINESELEGVFDLELKKHQIKEYAFPSIVAGGQRACTLHYGENNQVVNDGEMVLIDLGSSYNLYCADISRTFPVNGKFTPRQKELYNVVLRCQQMVLETAKPGMTLLELNQKVIEFYQEELPKVGLLKDGKTVRDYYFHSVSHQLGLVCHDVGDRSAKLEAGMVISNEPGLYVEEEGIGIRIEDDIVITENGAYSLSTNILKTVEDIEKLMAK